VRNNPETTKDKKEGWKGGAPDSTEDSHFQPMERAMPRQISTLQLVEDPTLEQVGIHQRNCHPLRAHARAGSPDRNSSLWRWVDILLQPVDSVTMQQISTPWSIADPCWSKLILKD